MKNSIIIDFNNTVGYFSQIIYLINIIEKTYSRKMTQHDVNILLNIYIHSFRPKIFEILKFIHDLKEKNIIHALVLYTKNKNEGFVKMVLSFIQDHILQNSAPPPRLNKQNMLQLFDHIIFSKTKTKHLDHFSKLVHIYDEIETRFCFIDNKNYNYEPKNSTLTIYYIECDTYKFYYTTGEIVKNMNYKIYSKLNKKIIHKYWNNIYKNRTIVNIPSKIHELNSLYVFNLLNNFCFLTK
jgi:hypothetical protein